MSFQLLLICVVLFVRICNVSVAQLHGSVIVSQVAVVSLCIIGSHYIAVVSGKSMSCANKMRDHVINLQNLIGATLNKVGIYDRESQFNNIVGMGKVNNKIISLIKPVSCIITKSQISKRETPKIGVTKSGIQFGL